MMFILEKEKIKKLLSGWEQDYEVYVPQRVEDYSEFLPYNSEKDIVLSDPHNTRYPPKAQFLPQSEVMLKYNRRLGKFEQVNLEPRPRILFGIRPCDAKAVTLLDTVFNTDEDRDPYWTSRRSATILIGFGCINPPQTCFCTTVGSGPFNHDGLDVIITEIDDLLYIEVISKKVENLFAGLKTATPGQEQAIHEKQIEIHEQMVPAFSTDGLKEKLDRIFDSNYWDEISESCLGCGICTFLCPTCFCFDIVDEEQRNERIRNWDTCMFRIYSQEASGHNPRPTRRERTRQRLMHKYSYWLDHIGQIGCTGCGRCVRYCPVGLDIRAMLRSANSLESEVEHAR